MLDETDDLRALDSRDLLGATASMSAHLTEGFELGKAAASTIADAKEIFVCALGGSAIGGDLAYAWLSESPGIPCSVVRSYSVPARIGPDSLAIVISYSGDTEETLSMAEQALERNAMTVTISSGGKLKDIASKHGVPHCAIPPGLVPRSTIGYAFGSLAGILDGAGIIDCQDSISSARESIERVRSHCAPEIETGENPAKKLAHSLHGTVPVVIGHGTLVPVARRWANQLNENAKMIAFSNELPEMNHNGIVGWAGDDLSRGFSMIFLEDEVSDSRMSRRIEATKAMMSERVRVYSSVASGSSRLARVFSSVMMGDYVSLYSAFARRVDPSTTEQIDEIKRILSEKRI
ncbi:MAG: bifunctional phosphoglucose/phosphomannose isomerase [Methanobacteriota archaeon]|nr:MAG: bifunctional phosphoglucose/phosphomannose isomerase [Euryarchaeota archaeon]